MKFQPQQLFQKLRCLSVSIVRHLLNYYLNNNKSNECFDNLYQAIRKLKKISLCLVKKKNLEQNLSFLTNRQLLAFHSLQRTLTKLLQYFRFPYNKVWFYINAYSVRKLTSVE